MTYEKTEQINRIMQMEERLERALHARNDRIRDPAAYEMAQEEIRLLSEYYFGPQWIADYEADERGELPQNLKRGVLSEDALYNLICENDRIRREESSAK